MSSCDLSDGWEYNSERDTCIKMFSGLKNHQEAVEVCQTRGAKLPSIPNPQTRDTYVSLMIDPSEFTVHQYKMPKSRSIDCLLNMLIPMLSY